MKTSRLATIILFFILLLLLIGRSIFLRQQDDLPLPTSLESLPVVERQDIGLSFEKGFFVDARDGEKYQWIRYEGGDKWMAENLRYQTANSPCAGNQDDCQLFGRLYNWTSAKRLCPKGWRLPKKEEWNQLLQQHGGTTNAFPTLANTPSGFNLTYGGVYHPVSKDFGFFNENGNYWTATSYDRQTAWHINISKSFEKIFSLVEDNQLAFSCRCIEGETTPIPDKQSPVVTESLPQPSLDTEKESVVAVSGAISITLFDPALNAYQPLSISDTDENSMADQKLGKPRVVNSKEEEYIPTFKINTVGGKFAYGIALLPNAKANLIFASSEQDDMADLKIGTPSAFTNQQPRTLSYLQYEESLEYDRNEVQILVLLSSTPIPIQELLMNRTLENIKQLSSLSISEKFMGSPSALQLSITQHEMEYQWTSSPSVFYPLLFTLKTL